MKKLFFIVFIALTGLPGFCQDIMTVLPDSGRATGLEFVGLKIFARDFGLNTPNDDLHFIYISQNSGYKLSHDMDLRGLSNIPHFGAGLDETYGHLLINFGDASVGYINHIWMWNAGAGAGCTTPLNRKNTLMFRAYVNLFYQNFTYGLGSYSDTTLYGFDINGANIGTYIKNVKYVNSMLCASATAEFMYRTDKLDFFIGAGYEQVIFSKESINFYRTHISIGDAIYNSSGYPVISGAILPKNYILQLGVAKEFGL